MRRLSRKSVIWKWIVSYICIILVSSISSVVTYQRSQNIIRERQEKINELVLEQGSEKIRECTLMLENLREEILINASYNSLNKSLVSYHKSTAYKQYLLYTDLNTYLKLNNSYSHIMLYFSNVDKVISDESVNFSKEYWNIFKNTLGLSFGQWTDLLNGTYDNFSAINVKNDDVEGTIFAKTLQPKQLGKQQVNLFVFFSKDDWKNLLGEYQFYENISMILLDQKGDTPVKLDYASMLSNNDDEKTILEAIKNGKDSITIGNNEVMQISRSQGISPCSIYMLTPNTFYLEPTQNFKNIFSIIFVISILFSIVLITIFVKNNYRPVGDLVKTIRNTNVFQFDSKDQIYQENENEFNIVKSRMTQVNNSYYKAKIELKKQNELLRGIYLSKLLNGKTKLLPKEQLKELYDIDFKYNDFVVALFYILDFTNSLMDTEDYENKTGLEKFGVLEKAQLIIVNEYKKLITEYGWSMETIKIDNMLALIICFPQEKNEGRVTSFMQAGSKSIKSSYNLEYLASLSNVHYNLDQLPTAYQEAMQTLEAIRLYGLDNHVVYSEVSELFTSSYNYPYSMEQELVKSIQLGNFTNAKWIYSEIIQNNINSKKYISRDIIRCLMFDLLGTVLRTFDAKKESQKFIKQLRPAKRLSECSDLHSMNEVFEQLLYDCCEYFKDGTNKDEEQCYEIEEYICENYQDQNLSVTSVAEHFCMSPVMLSKLYREITGTKILDAISRIRVQEAKNLLLASNDNLTSIANQVGFGSTKTFTRSFKQFEGCTPGQWRDNQRMLISHPII